MSYFYTSLYLKEAHRDLIHTVAERLGMSVSAFIRAACVEKAERLVKEKPDAAVRTDR
jgi:uncharacterized protein (DUF1778 family)